MFRSSLTFLFCVLVGAGCSSNGTDTTTGQPAGSAANATTIELIRAAARPLTGAASEYDELFALIGNARFLLLGEQTHGTREFYEERARISRRLIEEKNFRIIALEADWPDAARVNRYINGAGTDKTADEALSSFTRFPTWMWRNEEMREFVEWLRAYNQSRSPEDRVQVFGMDVYSGFASAQDVVSYLERVDTAAAREARERYSCFGKYRSAEEYAVAVLGNRTPSCASQVSEQLTEMQQRANARGGNHDPDLLAALQSARVVRNAEEYYRLAHQSGIASWNLRDRHMADVVDAASAWNARASRSDRVIAWAHNSHMGDARMTERSESGELNLGQLMRQRHPSETRIIGFTTYEGTVMAASDWGERGRAQPLRPAIRDSYAGLFHAVAIPAFYLPVMEDSEVARALSTRRLQRAVGVVYAPQSEMQSHYFEAQLGQQFDAVLHFDRTRAVRPL